jgi:hypothetical protein
LAGFFIDLGIAAVTLVGLSMVTGLFWGFYRAIVVSRANAEANGGALTPTQSARQWASPAPWRRS